MELEIKNKYENKLLKRAEIDAILKFDAATPSNDEVKTKLSAQLGGDKSLVVVDHIYTTFGTHEAKVIAKIYDDKGTMEQFEPKPKKSAEKPAEGSAEATPAEGGDAPAEEKKEEAPAEETKPEEKPEEKAEEKKEEAPAEETQDKPAEEKPEKPPAEEKKEAE